MSSKFEILSLQPSEASRWSVCRASPGFIVQHAAELVEESSEWADEGTQAHTVASNILTDKPAPEGTPVEMLANVMQYVECVRDKMEPGAVLLVEQKVPLFYDKKRRGTADSVVINPRSIYIPDLKYGEGVSVEARNNKQLAIYGRSVIEDLIALGYEFPGDHLVVLIIVQPRARDGRVTRIWSLTLAELWAFTETLGDIAQSIIADPLNQPFVASDETCKFCPAAAICGARTGTMLAALPDEVSAPLQAVLTLPDLGTLTAEQLGKIVQLGGPIKKFFDDAREHAFSKAINGEQIPGCKVVAGNTSRKWRSLEEAERLLRQRFNIDEYKPRELLSVAQAEKLVKPLKVGARYQNLFDANVTRLEGKPTLVSEDDPRPALDLNPAAEFTALPSTEEPNLLD